MNVLSCLAHGLSAEVSGVDLDLKKKKKQTFESSMVL